jgi:hypothetical protein
VRAARVTGEAIVDRGERIARLADRVAYLVDARTHVLQLDAIARAIRRRGLRGLGRRLLGERVCGREAEDERRRESQGRAHGPLLQRCTVARRSIFVHRSKP